MADVLEHAPTSHTNPYVPAPNGRIPRHPTEGETVRVAATGRTDAKVHIVWECGDTAIRVDAERRDDHWEAEFGPIDGDFRYRFCIGDEPATDWFETSVRRRQDAPFTGVRAAGGVIEAGFDGGTLRLEPAHDVELRLELAVEEPGDASGDQASSAGWTVRLADGGGLAISGPAGDWDLLAPQLVVGPDGPDEIELAWMLEDGERIFGTGERFDRLDQRGRTPDVRVYEQYKQQGTRTYFPLPFLVSSTGRGLHIDTAERLRFDLGATQTDRASFRVPLAGRPLEVTLWNAAPSEILRRYTADVGRSHPLPIWAYGPWMSGNEWNSDRRVREVVGRTLDENVPATVIVIEAWSDEASFYLFNDTTYEPVDPSQPVDPADMTHGEHWPDPKRTIDWLHDQGLRVLLWQIPALKEGADDPQHLADLAHAEREGYCVTTDDGAPYRNRGWWFPGARIIDFTNPDARRWWMRKRAWLVEHLGIDGFKTDGGEHLWGDDVRTHAGESGDVAANRYPAHYIGAYHELLRDHGHDRPVTFSRAGFTGAQATPAHWAGDEDSTWEAYRASLTAGLSAGMSGIAHWGWDLAGFSGPLPTSELYLRAAATACFCPIMQYHSELNDHRTPPIDRTPWNVAEQRGDPAALDIYRFYARLRMNLVPHLNGLGHEAAETGLPIMRALALRYPDDPVAVGIDDQYLLGDDLLVAPVLTPDTTDRRVYLPGDGWHDLWTGAAHDSGWTEIDTPADRIPVFVRAGAAIPLWVADGEVELASPVGLAPAGEGRLALLVAPGDRTTTIVDPHDETDRTVAVNRDGGGVAVGAPDLSGVAVRVLGGGTAELGHDGTVEVGP